jgi:hypothetical protein
MVSFFIGSAFLAMQVSEPSPTRLRSTTRLRARQGVPDARIKGCLGARGFLDVKNRFVPFLTSLSNRFPDPY